MCIFLGWNEQLIFLKWASFLVDSKTFSLETINCSYRNNSRINFMKILIRFDKNSSIPQTLIKKSELIKKSIWFSFGVVRLKEKPFILCRRWKKRKYIRKICDSRVAGNIFIVSASVELYVIRIEWKRIRVIGYVV